MIISRKRIFISILILTMFLILHIKIYENFSRQKELIGWCLNTSRDLKVYIWPDKNSALIEPRNICDKFSGEQIFLLVVVCSAVNNFIERQTIRDTWGNKDFHKHDLDDSNSTKGKKLVFIIGLAGSRNIQEKIRYESLIHGDLIQENFVDSYGNLTLKSIFMLKWLTNNCLNKVQFVMKCDDDSFIHVPNLLEILNGKIVPVYQISSIFNGIFYSKIDGNFEKPVTGNENLMLGYLFQNSKPVANPRSKWYSPAYMFPGDTYPDYLSGSSYIMSMDIIPKLFNKSLSIPLFHLEDVYITGIIANDLNLRLQHHSWFFPFKIKELCDLRRMVSQHYFSVDQMRDAFNFVTNASISCDVV